jgi:hypothetical protein
MPPLTSDEALELANKFSETGANIILNYQTGPWNADQKRELKKTAHELIYKALEMETVAVGFILEDAQTSLTDLKEFNGEVQSTISRLKNFKRIIDICTATLKLAAAIVSKDIDGIMNSVLELKSLLFTELKEEVFALRGIAALAAIPSATPTVESMRAMVGTRFVAALNAVDLTGKWSCDDDGTYYLRQIGSTIYWYGERTATSPQWSNVFVGQIQGNVVSGSWADVPKGQASANGEMRFQISADGNSFDCVYKTGGFGGSHWNKPGSTPPVCKRKFTCTGNEVTCTAPKFKDCTAPHPQ